MKPTKAEAQALLKALLKVMTKTDIAAKLGKTEAAVYNWLKRGKLPCQSDFDAMVEREMLTDKEVKI